MQRDERATRCPRAASAASIAASKCRPAVGAADRARRGARRPSGSAPRRRRRRRARCTAAAAPRRGARGSRRATRRRRAAAGRSGRRARRTVARAPPGSSSSPPGLRRMARAELEHALRPPRARARAAARPCRRWACAACSRALITRVSLNTTRSPRARSAAGRRTRGRRASRRRRAAAGCRRASAAAPARSARAAARSRNRRACSVSSGSGGVPAAYIGARGPARTSQSSDSRDGNALARVDGIYSRRRRDGRRIARADYNDKLDLHGICNLSVTRRRMGIGGCAPTRCRQFGSKSRRFRSSCGRRLHRRPTRTLQLLWQDSKPPRCRGFFLRVIGAGRGSRIPTVSPPADFESAASTSSAIPAWGAGRAAAARCPADVKAALSRKPAPRPARCATGPPAALHVRHRPPSRSMTCDPNRAAS